jgi:phytoene dehydrogenase-like protein
MSKKAIVVGSGIAGIASAIRLAVKGYDVTVYEANSYPGGKLTAFQLGDYRFDAGPSLFTMPQFVEELFRLAGKNPSNYFQYVKHDTACHYFFEDGTFLPFKSDKEEVLVEVEKTLNINPRPLAKHFEKSAFIYEKTHEAFLEKSLHLSTELIISGQFDKVLIFC